MIKESIICSNDKELWYLLEAVVTAKDKGEEDGLWYLLEAVVTAKDKGGVDGLWYLLILVKY